MVEAGKAEVVEAGWTYIALQDVKGVLEALRSGAITNTSTPSNSSIHANKTSGKARKSHKSSHTLETG